MSIMSVYRLWVEIWRIAPYGRVQKNLVDFNLVSREMA